MAIANGWAAATRIVWHVVQAAEVSCVQHSRCEMEMKDLKDSALFNIPKFPELYLPPNNPEFRMPEIPPNPLLVTAEANYASEFYKRLTKWIGDFDAALDQAYEVGVRLVSFGQSTVFSLHGMSYWNPSLIRFSGVTEDGSPVELIQHVTQISVLLMKLPRIDPSKPKRRIGFDSTAVSDDTGENP